MKSRSFDVFMAIVMNIFGAIAFGACTFFVGKALVECPAQTFLTRLGAGMCAEIVVILVWIFVATSSAKELHKD